MGIPTSPDRFHEVDRILDACLRLDPAERVALLERTTRENPEVGAQVRSLLEIEARGEAWLGESVTDFAEPLFAAEAPEALEEFPPGTELGPYRIGELLGRGGMGRVYRATRIGVDFIQDVAVKVVKRGMDTEEVLQRFRFERRVLASLDHPGIARLIDGGVTPDGRPYLVMEHVEGRPLDRFLDEENPSRLERLQTLRDVAQAVAHAHARGVVHRDLKPSNVLVDTQGRPRLLDFGIARLLEGSDFVGGTVPLTRTGRLLLTPEYASPEQKAGAVLTPASDVYQLGLLLAGALPELREERSDAGIVLATALADDPERRYPDARALARDLEALLSGHPIEARAPSAGYRLRRWVGRHPALSAALSVGVVLSAGFLLAHTHRLGVERDRAEAEALRAGAVTDFLVGLLGEAAPARTRGDTLTVFDLLDRGEDRLETELADQPETRAQLHQLVGRLRSDLGDPARGEENLLAALSLRESLHGPEHLEVAQTLITLGHLLTRRSDFVRARDTFDRAGEIAERPENRRSDGGELALARARLGAGINRTFLGEGEAGVELLEEALSLASSTEGGDRVASDARVALGTFFQRSGLFDRGEPYLREELENLRGREEPDDPSTAIVLNNLANLLFNRGDPDAAEPLYLEALEIRRRLHGPDHPEVSLLLNNLAGVPRARQDWIGADTLYEASLRIKETLYGRHSRDVALTLNNRAHTWVLAGDPERAEPVLREAMEILHDLGQGEGPDLALAHQNLGDALSRMGREEEALPHFETALALRKAAHGPQALQVAWRSFEVGRTLERLGRHHEALPHYRRNLEIRTAHFEAERPEAVLGILPLANALITLGEVEEARTLLAQAQEAVAGEEAPAQGLRGQVEAALQRLEADR